MSILITTTNTNNKELIFLPVIIWISFLSEKNNFQDKQI